MPKFRVVGLVTISMSTLVEAATEAEAIEIANDRTIMSLCHQCASGEDDDQEWVTSGELDGTPHDLVAEDQDE